MPSITIGSIPSAGTMEVSGGTVSAAQNINVGSNNFAGIFNQSGGFVTSTMPVILGSQGTNAAIVSTLNLNGGTLNTSAIVNGGSGDTNIVNFNGGLLQANSDNSTFLSGMTHAYVLAGGAKIDDGGFAIEIDQNLESGGSPDGGLTKYGAGTLTLDGTNTYMGGTTVTDGTLIVTNNEAIADGTSLTVGDPSAFAPAPVVPSSTGGSGLNAAIAAVPEPGTLALLAAVLGGAAVYRRLRRRA